MTTVTLHLPCPECRADVAIEDADQYDGAAVRCLHCGTESVLQRERVGHGEHIRWELIDAGDDEEP